MLWWGRALQLCYDVGAGGLGGALGGWAGFQEFRGDPNCYLHHCWREWWVFLGLDVGGLCSYVMMGGVGWSLGSLGRVSGVQGWPALLSPPLLEGMMSLPWALFYLKPALNLKTTNPPFWERPWGSPAPGLWAWNQPHSRPVCSATDECDDITWWDWWHQRDDLRVGFTPWALLCLPSSGCLALSPVGSVVPWAHLGSSLERQGWQGTFLKTYDSVCYFKASSGSEPGMWSSFECACLHLTFLVKMEGLTSKAVPWTFPCS